jgi:holo-[acyl-carrier protein] synthase
MIYGIGIDLVKIKRIADAHQRWGERFHNKAFTPGEVRYCLRKRDPAPNLAARFAAKEALVKALGIGLRRGVHLRDVEVVRGALGKPVLTLHGKAREICEHEGITGIFISLTHDQDFSAAVVVLEKT